MAECANPTSTVDECLPTVIGVAMDGSFVASKCKCATQGDQCGPVNVLDTPIGITLSCIAQCPDPTTQNCRVYRNGLSTGVTSIPATSVAAGDVITCECEPPSLGACCFSDAAGIVQCQDGVSQTECDNLFGTFHLNQTCLGKVACCMPDGSCRDIDKLCCDDFGGVSQPAGSDCTQANICNPPVCPMPSNAQWCINRQAIDCPASGANSVCRPYQLTMDVNEIIDVQLCDCYTSGCGPLTIVENPPGMPPYTFICEKACTNPDGLCEVHLDGVAQGSVLILSNAVSPGQVVSCGCVTPPIDCQPNQDGSACIGACPGNTQACVPQAINCDSATGACKIVQCGCNSEDQLCHVDFPPPGSTKPVCTGGCPPSLFLKKCVRRKVDSNGDGIKDAWGCRCVKKFATPVLVPGERVLKGRYLTFALPAPGGSVASSAAVVEQMAIRVTMDELHVPKPDNLPCCPSPDFSAFNGNQMWVGPVSEYNNTVFPVSTFNGAALGCDPWFDDFVTPGPFSIYAAEVIPSSTYSIQVVSIDCIDSLDEEDCYSAPLVQLTGRWGDVTTSFQAPDPPLLQPNVTDITDVVDHLKGIPGSGGKTSVQLHPNGISPVDDVSILDVVFVIDALKGIAYPFSGPCACPSTVACTVGGSCVADNECMNSEACIDNICPEVDDCRRCTP